MSNEAHPRRSSRRYSPARARSLLQRLRAVLWSPDQIALLAEEQLETRQQLLHENNKLGEEQHALREEQHALRDALVEITRELRSVRLDLTAQNAVTAERIEAHRRDTATIGRSVAAIGEALARIDAPDPATLVGGPLVSVVLPVRDRAATVGTAVRCVLDQTYPNWELLVVDDASTDDSSTVVTTTADGDPRVRILEGPGRGAPAARNVALREARGEIIAYVDSDNRWLPTYLAHVVSAFRRHPDAGSAVAMQLVVDDRSGLWWIRDDDRPLTELETANFIDLNAYSHRRDLLDDLGPFDETLLRLSDWDLARRHAASRRIVRIPSPGSVYRFGHSDQITNTQPRGWYEHLVHRKHRRRLARPLRVLCAEWHYPQLSESYLQADIDGLKALGAQVEIWSDETHTAAPFAVDDPVHHGSLRAVIDRVRPDVVLTHWLNIGDDLSDEIAGTGVPMVVRGHGFDFDPELVSRLGTKPAVARVYVFPHFSDRIPGPTDLVRALPVAFDAERYTPSEKKNRFLVVRAGAAIPTKDYDTFFEAASACPDHLFVLCLVHAHRLEGHVDDVIARRDALAPGVEIRTDVSHDAMAELIGAAGIYLHTHGTTAPLGMPISIAESMATGAYVIARDLPGMREYTGDAADLYSTPAEAAALIRATTGWSDAQWRDAANRSIDRAFSRFTNLQVAHTMVDDWQDSGLLDRKLPGSPPLGSPG